MNIFDKLQQLHILRGLEKRRHKELCKYEIAQYHSGFWTPEKLRKLDEHQLRETAKVICSEHIGHVDFPVVTGEDTYAFFGTAIVECTHNKDNIDPNLSQNQQKLIQETLNIVRSYEKCPDQYFSVRLTAKSKENDTIQMIEGDSFMLALALATISAIRKKPVSEIWICTGKIGLSGTIEPVGDIQLKIRLFKQERPMCTLLIPKKSEENPKNSNENFTRCLKVSSLNEVVSLCLPVSTDIQIIELKEKLKQPQKQWKEIICIAENLREQTLSYEKELLVFSSLLQGYNHTNQEELAREIVKKLETFDFQNMKVSAEERTWANIGVHYIDILQPSLILETLKHIEEAIRRMNQTAIHLRGSYASCLMDAGQVDDALNMYQKNIEITSRLLTDCDREEYARCLGDYGDTLRRIGKYEEAEEFFLKALKHLETYTNFFTKGFVIWHYGKLLIESRRYEEFKTWEGQISIEHDWRPFFLSTWKLYQVTQDTTEVEIQKEIETIAGLLGGNTILLRMFELRAKMLWKPSEGIINEIRSLSPEYDGLEWEDIKKRLPY